MIIFASVMANIITDIPTIVTTAELPDNIEIAIDGASAEVFVMIGAVPIFQTTLFAYEGRVTLYDLRAIMEEYLRGERGVRNVTVNPDGTAVWKGLSIPLIER